MPVYYAQNKIIPAPLVSITREIVRSEDGTARRSGFIIALKGKIFAWAGSPNSSGEFWNLSGYPADENIAPDSRLASFRAKQGAFMGLFDTTYKLLEIQPYDGSAPIKAVCRVRNISFPEGKWYDTCDYDIQLEADRIWFGDLEIGGSDADTTPAEENWSVEQADDKGRTYRIQHTVTATAKPVYDINGTFEKAGWEAARDIVLSESPKFLGLDSAIYGSPNTVDLSTWYAYNYVRGHQIDEAGGKYTAVESWLLYDRALTNNVPCLEDYTITVRYGEDGRTKVSIDGNLTGLEDRNNSTHTLSSTRWTNVNTRWTQLDAQLLNLCSDNSGVTLNSSVLSKTVAKNSINGTISFSAEYDDRPTVVSGARNSSIQISLSNPTDVFASLVVLGKANGPVLQSIGTVTAKRKTVVVEAQMGAQTMTYTPTMPNTDLVILPYYPGGFKERDEISWSDQTGRYSRQVSWTWV